MSLVLVLMESLLTFLFQIMEIQVKLDICCFWFPIIFLLINNLRLKIGWDIRFSTNIFRLLFERNKIFSWLFYISIIASLNNLGVLLFSFVEGLSQEMNAWQSSIAFRNFKGLVGLNRGILLSETLMAWHVITITKETWWKNCFTTLNGGDFHSFRNSSPSVLRLPCLIVSIGIDNAVRICLNVYDMTGIN